MLIFTRKLVVLMFMLAVTLPGVAISKGVKGINLESSFNESIGKHNNIKWVTIENIEKSLPKHPINVGFDLDDTLFFSSPCIYKLTQDIIKEKGLHNCNQNEIWNVINNDKNYWNELAFCNGQYSIPKQSAIKLIRMHQKRGDKIFFITARYKPTSQQALIANDNSIKALLPNAIGLILPVQYTNSSSKTALMKRDKLSIYYGDADSDILDARAAGVRPIRFIRSEASTALPIPLVGQWGEEVLIGSYN